MNYIPRIEYTVTPLTVDFTLPPSKDFRNQNVKTSQRTTKAGNGVVQTQFNYNEETFAPFFTLVPESVYQQFQSFFLNHGSRGLEFDYYPSNDEPEFITVTLNKFDFKPKILFPSNVPNEFFYEWGMTFRQTV